MERHIKNVMLKACPFCGSQAVYLENSGWFPEHPEYNVVCLGCDIRFTTDDNRDKWTVVDAWNKRGNK